MTKFMWFQLISILFILAILSIIVITENSIVTDALDTVSDYCVRIEAAIDQNDGILNDEIVFLTNNLEYHWTVDEERLCYMVNHKSIQEIGVEISRLKSYLSKGDDKEYFASLNVIKLYAKAYNHFMGANTKNIL